MKHHYTYFVFSLPIIMIWVVQNILFASLVDSSPAKYPYALPPLSYSYDALEPYIDQETMRIHHTKHHKAYIDNLNKALEKYPALAQKSLEDLLKSINEIPEEIRETIRNNAGGTYNHNFFWKSMKPNAHIAKGFSLKKLIDAHYKHYLPKPTPALTGLINKYFADYATFQDLFNQAAKSVFGSGWVWLCLNDKKELIIITTPNQDSPISRGLIPLLGLDVWEHAYYLKYQNERMRYIDAWWYVVNWDYAQELLDKALK